MLIGKVTLAKYGKKFRIWTMKPIRIFMSFSMNDRLVAGLLKELLESCLGFEVFLAHDDLSPSDNWPNEILKNLENADFIVPLISKNFHTSSFANQEIGFSLAKQKIVIPVSIEGINPPGFLKDIQAYKCSINEDGSNLKDELAKFVSRIYLICIQHSNFRIYKSRAIILLIYSLSKSPSFRITSIILNLLIDTHKSVAFTKQQLQLIVLNAKNNPNVYKTAFLFPKLKTFLRVNYGYDIDFPGEEN